MRQTIVALLTAAAIPAVLGDNQFSSATTSSNTVSKRDLSALLRRETCSTSPECSWPGAAANAPYTCNVPVTNDPAKVGIDTLNANGYGVCRNGTCSCEVDNLSFPDLMVACTYLLSRLNPQVHTIDACVDHSASQLHCSFALDSIPAGTYGDVTVTSSRVCYNGVYSADGKPPASK